MNNSFKKPDLKAPRYREKRLGILNEKTIKEFKDKKPLYSNIDNNKLKKIIKLYNVKLWNAVINHRDGVELPDSLGYLFIGTCPSSKTINPNYALSHEYGKVLQIKNRELWRFVACREFKRAVAKTYPENWTKYLVMKNKYRVAHLYDQNVEQTKEALKNYNEFEI